MWCRVLFETYFYMLWIFCTEKTSAEKQLMSGKVQDRYKRDLDILVECDMDCVADEEVGEYDVLLEYDLEETYQALTPYSSSYMDYGHFGTPSKCSYTCKILKLSKTGDVNGNVKNQIVSIEDVDENSVEEIIGEGLNSNNLNFLPPFGELKSSTVSQNKMETDGLSSETPFNLTEDLEVRMVESYTTKNAITTAAFKLPDASNVNSAETDFNRTDTLNLDTSELVVDLSETAETPKATSEPVLTTSTTTKPIIMVPKVIRLTVFEAEMMEAESLKRPPTVKTPSENFVHGFFHPVNNSSAKISLNNENATEQLQIKYGDVPKYHVNDTTFNTINNFNASMTFTSNGSSCNISLKCDNTTQRPLLKDEAATISPFIETTYDFLHKYNSVKRVLSVDADKDTTSTENIDQTTYSISKRNSTVSINSISSVGMNELNPSLEDNPITTTEKVEVSLETEGIYTEEKDANNIIVSEAPTHSENPRLLEEVNETNSNLFSSNTAIPTTNGFSKASTNDNDTVSNAKSTIGSLGIQTTTSLNMNINISINELSNITDGNTSADYIELLKSLIVEEQDNATDSSIIESIYSNPSTVFTSTEDNSFENTTNYDFAFSGNFTSNDSSYPKEFNRSLIDKLKQLDTGANVEIMPQNHSSSKDTGITTLRKVGSGQGKEETSH